MFFAIPADTAHLEILATPTTVPLHTGQTTVLDLFYQIHDSYQAVCLFPPGYQALKTLDLLIGAVQVDNEYFFRKEGIVVGVFAHIRSPDTIQPSQARAKLIQRN